MDTTKEHQFEFTAEGLEPLFVTARMDWNESDECWDFTEMEAAYQGYGEKDVSTWLHGFMIGDQSVFKLIRTKAHLVNDADVYY